MKSTTDNCISVRLPKELVKQVKKLKKKQNLPSMASALKFWLEQQQNERIETRLTELQETINQSQEAVCAAFHLLFGENHKITQQMKKAMNCAAFQGKDTCPMEGLSEDEMAELRQRIN